MPPEIVLVGHLAQDLQPDGTFRLGGTVTYAALMAERLGLRPGIVTSAPEDDLAQLTALIPHLQVASVPASTPTIFENIYEAGQRRQFVRARAAPLTVAAIPPAWRSAPLTLLGPIADEIPPDVAACLTGAIRAATPQGWLRAWGDDGRVTPIPWRAAPHMLPYLTALILSVEDLAIAAGEADALATVEGWAAQVPIVLLTDGPRGATLWHHGARQHIPGFPVAEVDPTGAGDCFAATFLITLHRTGDPLAAVRHAHAAASFVVQAPGTSGIPTPEQIAERLAEMEDA